MASIRAVIHVHTDYSADCDISVDFLADYAAARGIECLAVTDHDAVEGALRVRDAADIKVIVGEEVSTSEGHLIGLFLNEWIPPGMSAQDTARAIKEQGGLVLVPHMYARAFGCGLRKVARRMVHLIDALEVNNAQSVTSGPDRLAERFANKHGLVKYVGSDTHLPCSIDPCYQEMDDFDTPAQFLRSLAGARLIRGYHPLRYIIPMYYRATRCWLGLPFPSNVGVNAQDPHRPAQPTCQAT